LLHPNRVRPIGRAPHPQRWPPPSPWPGRRRRLRGIGTRRRAKRTLRQADMLYRICRSAGVSRRRFFDSIDLHRLWGMLVNSLPLRRLGASRSEPTIRKHDHRRQEISWFNVRPCPTTSRTALSGHRRGTKKNDAATSRPNRLF
jgi:hypothetical protein